MNLRDFSSGDCFDVYKWLGAQFDGFGTTFRVYAPNAEGVSVIGDFNGWQDWYLNRTGDGKFWEIRITDARPGQMYKYKVYHGGSCVEHCDPVGFGMELRPKFASIIRDMRFDFDDLDWMEKRHTWHGDALNIYEVHLGSWRTDPGDPNGWYKYEDIAPQLVKYCKEHGYNCVELMPLNEYPCDESWGYQATGFFSPTSRYGTAEGLKKLVNICHKNGIAVLMDYVPVHFAVDGYALAQFDGTPTYESQFKDIAFSEWGSCNFDFTKGPVCSFLKSAANYWLTEYHFDGLRMDAISRVIYYMGDPSRGENVCGVKFLKSLNRGLKWIPSVRDTLRGGFHGLPDGNKAGGRRRSRLRLQVGHGLDERHAQLLPHPAGRAREPLPQADILDDVLLQREVHTPAFPRRERTRQGYRHSEDVRRLRR